jgi:hypothetical protein
MTDPEKPTTEETSIYTAYLSDLGRIGERHQSLRQFYVSVVTALLAFVGLSKANDALFDVRREVLVAAGIVGIAMCVLWALQMMSFASIFSAKVAVLKRIEGNWSIQPFAWEGAHSPRLTTIDFWAAIAVIIIFLVILFVRP